MTRLLVPIGLLLTGVLLLAGATAGWLTRHTNATAIDRGSARIVLWYPTGATAGCIRSRGVSSCSATPIGNINENGKVAARGVHLKAGFDDFRWTVSPDQVMARNRRQMDAYIACIAAEGARCAEPDAVAPSWNSGMRVQWSPEFDGAYPVGADPTAGTGGWAVPIVLGVAGIGVTAASAWWVVSRRRRPRPSER